jgi:uncharacterized membrane protein
MIARVICRLKSDGYSQLSIMDIFTNKRHRFYIIAIDGKTARCFLRRRQENALHTKTIITLLFPPLTQIFPALAVLL